MAQGFVKSMTIKILTSVIPILCKLCHFGTFLWAESRTYLDAWNGNLMIVDFFKIIDCLYLSTKT